MVSHDAGGAEILSAWYRLNKDRFNFYFYLSGPAKHVFQKNHGPLKYAKKTVLKKFIANDFILTSTSLESNWERNIIKFSKKIGVKCFSILDHWDLYKERFSLKYDWKKKLPNQVWVLDKYALKKAINDGFPKKKMKLIKNPYFKWLKTKRMVPNKSSNSKFDILYVCEPISRKINFLFKKDNKKYSDEIDIFKKFMQVMHKNKKKINSITIRPHPSENKKKYLNLMIKYSKVLNIKISTQNDIIDDINSNSILIGIESFGLVLGLLFNKKTYSCVIDPKYEISLPHKKIEKISDFNAIFKKKGFT